MGSTARRTLLAAWLLASASAHAAVTLRLDDTRNLSLGVGLRVSAAVGAAQPETGAPEWSRPDVLLDNAVVGMLGQLHPNLRLQLNLTLLPGGELRALDAVAMFEPSQWVNVWAGRMLPPVDRASLTGPLFSSTWDLPFVGIRGALPMGRDDGVTLWGSIVPERLGYRVGVFRGPLGDGGSLGQLLVAGRLTLNLLEPEPGYLHTGTTYGARDVLSFGIGARRQGPGETGDSTGLTTLVIDGLFEKKLPGDRGVITAEAAVYRSAGGTLDARFDQAVGVYVLAGYLFPFRLGSGRLQGIARFQLLDALGAGQRRTREDLNLTWVVQGHPLRFSLVGYRESFGAGTTLGARIGAQLIL